MNLEIRHLKLVEAVAETGSVTRAGHRLHLTQSALSHQLRDVEEQLGVALFERKNGRMSLTSAGDRLLETARMVLTELARAESEIQTSSGPAKGRLRISTQCHTAYHWFPPRLLIFQKKFPNVEVQLVLEAASNPFEALLDGKLDLAIICDPVRNRKIRYTPLFEDDVLIVVPPKHRLAVKNFVTPEDFAAENILVYPPKSESTLLSKILEPAGVRPRRVQEVLLTEVILEMIIGGLGIAALPRWAVGPQAASGVVIGVPLQLPVAVVCGPVARQSCAGLRPGVRPDHRRPPHACRFLSPDKPFSRPARTGQTPTSCCGSNGLWTCGARSP